MSACPVCSWTPGDGPLQHGDYVRDLMIVMPATTPLSRYVELVSHRNELRAAA